MFDRFACLVFLTALFVVPAKAEDFVIISSSNSGADYAPGRTFDVGDKIELVENAKIALITSSGQILHLRGPYQGQLVLPRTTNPSAKDSLSPLTSFLQRIARRTESIGASRRAQQKRQAILAEDFSDVWTVDVEKGGAACVRDGPVKLRRRQADARLRITIWPLAGPKRQVEWPNNQNVLQLAGDFSSGAQLSISGRKGSIAIILWVLPKAIDPASTGKVLLWLSAKGCEGQVLRLIAQMNGEKPQSK